MSDQDLLSRVLTILLIVAGAVLLLPGICAGYFMLSSLSSPGGLSGSGLQGLWAACFAVAALGVALVVWAGRRLSR